MGKERDPTIRIDASTQATPIVHMLKLNALPTGLARERGDSMYKFECLLKMGPPRTIVSLKKNIIGGLLRAVSSFWDLFRKIKNYVTTKVRMVDYKVNIFYV